MAGEKTTAPECMCKPVIHKRLSETSSESFLSFINRNEKKMRKKLFNRRV